LNHIESDVIKEVNYLLLNESGFKLLELNANMIPLLCTILFYIKALHFSLVL